ncbi:MAG TPA: flagellar hook-associated protein FlgL [Polyangia bacterium]|nr:flagellar hook-associated protein FlgL [Polyangia bacterium]
MRVSDKMFYDLATKNALDARDRVLTASQEAATGKRVTSPGDDPSAAGLIVRDRTQLIRLDAINQGAGRANDELSMADSNLQQLSNVVTRARELAEQLSNDSYSAAERGNAVAEVNTLFNQALSLMNVDFNGRYIFGGTKDNQPPFDASGNYQGDTNVRQIEVAPGVLEDSSVRADVAVKGVGGGADLFATLNSLSTALGANDGSGIRAAFASLDSVNQQVGNALAKVGASMDAFDAAQSIAASTKLTTTKTLSGEQDADVFEATSNLALANHALDATLTASAASFQMSLVDKL